MNTKRLLNKLICFFVLLNITLFICNIVKTVTNYRLSDERIDNIISVLEARGIQIKPELSSMYLPKVEGTLNNIIDVDTTVQRDQLVKALFGGDMSNTTITMGPNTNKYISPMRIYNNGEESISFDQDHIIYENNVKLMNKETITLQAAKKICNTFIRRIEWQDSFKNAYVTHTYQEDDLMMTYYPTLEKIPVFNSYITFTLSGNTITKAVMRLGNVTVGKEQWIRQAIYPIDVVLFGIADELTSESGSSITAITLGYMAEQGASKAIFGEKIIPVYKIDVDCLNSPIYVNAYTNRRIE